MLTRAPAGLQLLERDTSKRLGVSGNIKIHPFFKTINWTLLEKRAVEPPFKPKVVCDLTSVGATHLLLPSTAFWAPPPSRFVGTLSSSPSFQQACFPGRPGTFCLCLYLCVLTIHRLSVSQSVSQQTGVTVDPATLQWTFNAPVCQALCLGNQLSPLSLPPSTQSIFQ